MPFSAKRARAAAEKGLVGFVVGSVRYAIDIGLVREIVTPLPLTVLPHTKGGLVGVADHRSEVVPVIDLRVRFDVAPRAASSRKEKWILVAVGGRTLGLVVDDVFGKITVPDADLRPPPDLGGGDEARAISAVAPQGGGLLFVLDIGRFERLVATFDAASIAPPGDDRGSSS